SLNGVKKMELQEGFIECIADFVANVQTINTFLVNNGDSYLYGNIQVFPFSTGIVHSDSAGILSSSLIVDNDITNGTISESKLAGSIPDSKVLTITSAGKVDNSATSATASNVA